MKKTTKSKNAVRAATQPGATTPLTGSPDTDSPETQTADTAVVPIGTPQMPIPATVPIDPGAGLDRIAARKARGLTERMARFCGEYTAGPNAGNGQQSAVGAGYAPGDNARITAAQLLTNPNVVQEIDRLTQAHEQALRESGQSFTLEDIDRDLQDGIKLAKDAGNLTALASLLQLASRRRGGLLDRSETKDVTDYGNALQEAISRADHQREVEAARRKQAAIHAGTDDPPIREAGAA